MSYSPDNHSSELNIAEQKLNAQITICRDIKKMVESEGWVNTTSPLLDRMIIDIVGGKLGDVWTSGKIDRARKDERREFYVGYKQALIDLHGRIMFHLSQLPILEDRLEALQSEKQGRYRVPMEDSRYNPEDK